MGDRLTWWTRKASLGDQSADLPNNSQRLQLQQANNNNKSIDSKHQLSQQQANNVIKQTPRLPRGVSKIPHQVINNAGGGDQDSFWQPIKSVKLESGSIESGKFESTNESSKYLTFSKDQASTHLRSLVSELNSTASYQKRLQPATGPPATSPRSAPMEDNICTSTTTSNTEQVDNQSSRQQQQQPLCEAFIMTGQSMLKLSCNESNNLDHKRLNKAATTTVLPGKHSSAHVTDTDRAKSASLGKLDENSRSALVANGAKSGHQLDYLEPIAQPRTNQRTSCCTSEHEQHATGAPAIECCRNGGVDGRQVAAVTMNTSASSETMQATPTTSQAEQGRTGTVAMEANATQKPKPPNFAPPSSTVDAGRRIDEATTAETANFHSSLAGKNEASSLNTSGEDQLQDHSAHQRQIINDNEQIGSNSGCNLPERSDMEESTGDDEKTEAMTALAHCERESARRLAKRLYNLSGFKRTDVSHHLAKQNPFSELVAEEYLNLFDFRGQRLDGALRKFLSKSQLNGETQERERTLSRFSRRFYQCNQDKYPSADAVQMLVCALILLNTDLHGAQAKQQKRHTKLSLSAFVDGLNSSLEAEAASSGKAPVCFARHQLADLYESIKKRPLKCPSGPDDKCDMSSLEAELDRIYKQQVSGNSRWNTLPSRRHAAGSNLAPSNTLGAGQRRQLKQSLNKLNGSAVGQQLVDQQETAIEFKCGYLTRKRIFDSTGKPTGKGRRSWRRVRVSLSDLRLVLRLVGKQTEEEKSTTAKQQEANGTSRAQRLAQDMKNTLKVHHSFAKPSTSYIKRAYVFHLRLADQAELLLQADSEQDMAVWVDTINFAAACLSSPALPTAVSNGTANRSPSNLKQSPNSSPARPILTTSYTRLSYWEQLIDHEERLQKLKLDLDEHLSQASETKNATKRGKTEFIERIAYLKQEIERYSTYVDLMRKKSNSPEAIILSKHPQIASLTPSQEMIQSLPGFALPATTDTQPQQQQQSNQTTNQAAQISATA